MRRLAVALGLVAASISMLMPISAGAAIEPIDLQGLIDEAPAGSTLHLEEGTYSGNVLIEKPLAIVGGGVAVIDAMGVGNGIDVTSPDVTLDGLIIRNTGDSLDRESAGVSAREAQRLVVVNCSFENTLFGVFARQSPDSVIRDNVFVTIELELGRRGDAIRVWESDRTQIIGNIVDGGRDSVMWYSDDLIVDRNQFTNGRYGLHFMYSHSATITNNVLEGNSVGGFLMYSKDLVFTGNFVAGNHGPSGYGLGMKEVDGATLDSNQFVGNRIGVYFDYSPISYDVVQNITSNLVAFNEVGLMFLPNVKRNAFSGNAFVENREQVGITSGGDFEGNFWTIDGVGNHWDDFSGFDADGDGIGDIAYKLDDLYSSLTDSHPEITFFADTPAARAVDMAARLFPTLRPRPKLIDEAPLIEMPTIADPPFSSGSGASTGLLGTSLALLAAAAVIILVPQRRIGALK